MSFCWDEIKKREKRRQYGNKPKNWRTAIKVKVKVVIENDEDSYTQRNQKRKENTSKIRILP